MTLGAHENIDVERSLDDEGAVRKRALERDAETVERRAQRFVVPERRSCERRSNCAESRSAQWMATRCPRVYDHRLWEQVILTGNPDLFPELAIPRRTALSWIRRGSRDVVTLEDEAWAPAYHVRIAKLERRVAMLAAILRLVLALLRLSGFKLERARVPDAADKRHLLSAIERARKAMPLSAALRVLQLSSSRYHAWECTDSAGCSCVTPSPEG